MINDILHDKAQSQNMGIAKYTLNKPVKYLKLVVGEVGMMFTLLVVLGSF